MVTWTWRMLQILQNTLFSAYPFIHVGQTNASYINHHIAFMVLTSITQKHGSCNMHPWNNHISPKSATYICNPLQGSHLEQVSNLEHHASVRWFVESCPQGVQIVQKNQGAAVSHTIPWLFGNFTACIHKLSFLAGFSPKCIVFNPSTAALSPEPKCSGTVNLPWLPFILIALGHLAPHTNTWRMKSFANSDHTTHTARNNEKPFGDENLKHWITKEQGRRYGWVCGKQVCH